MPSLADLLARAQTSLVAGDSRGCLLACDEILATQPQHPEALHFAGLAHAALNDRAKGIDCIRQAVGSAPTFAAAWSNLGSLLMDEGELAEAEHALRTAIRHGQPSFTSPLYNLGNLLRHQGRLTEAEDAYGKVLAVSPHHHATLYNLASTLQEHGRLDAALALAQTALRLAPQHAESAFLVGNLLRTQGRLAEALAAYDTALASDPGHAACHTNRGNLLSEQGRPLEALAAFQTALNVAPHNERYASNLLCALHYIDGITPEALLDAHLFWDQRYGCPEPRPAPPRPSRTGQPLTVGLVSADFGCHPVGWFCLPLVEGADSQDMRLVLYSDRLNEDQNTHRLEQAAFAFRRIRECDDEQVAEMIAADGIDVLIDASGHTGHNRLSLFANRAAPLQASWAAYVGTTGVAAMDLLLADACQIPAGDENLYRERVIRLPVGYVPYAAPPYAPAPQPRQMGVPLTFGSFNNPVKLSEGILQQWALLLGNVPSARLLVKFRHLDDPATAKHLRMRFAAAGGDISRLDIEGGAPHAEMLAAYHRVDVALDAAPYSGGLTTLEALWMGVPVITMPGRTFASRHSLSHLTHLGLAELCSQDWDDYRAKAASLITDSARLARYRDTLRPHLQASPLMNGAGFARHLSQALRAVWEEA